MALRTVASRNTGKLDAPLAAQRDVRPVTLEQLRAFVGVAEDGGFQRASLTLHRSQSAITQSIRKLEDILDCRLLERRQGHVGGLTAAGERFLPAAQDVLARLSEAVAAVQRPELAGRIALGVPDDFRVADIHGAISRCLSVNRGLRVEITSTLSSKIARLLDSGRLDLGILRTTAPQAAAARLPGERVLRIETLHWVSRSQIAADALAEVPLVVFPEGCAYRTAALDALGRAGRTAYFAYVSACDENVLGAISAGLGVGILPRSAIAPDHVVLGAADGFPDLPPVRLSLIVRSKGALFEHFADVLEAAADVFDPADGTALTPRQYGAE
ncbi:LysR family transcriptional regulator [Blastochloris tepida]|uniref:LysR family transcriptional regulator n=1 Tax=Blastochloris tepida TaxID=2233851 RepID=A0A348FYU1_9HYPH|nr:LysR family transcriptional regulator [Blastochloris tepida]BBF92474.1 LysR family transcriptional regulator [Blastochloris tepida]